jgi:hypothetical protein
MASVTLRPNGHRWVTFKAPNGKRQTLRLGPATEQQAHNFKEKVERLLVCRRLIEPLDAALVEFLSELPDGLHDTLSRCGVIAPRGARTVGALTTWFIGRYTAHCANGRRKHSTFVNVKRAADATDRFFGRDRKLSSFRSYLETGADHQTDGERFRAWLIRAGNSADGPLAPTTASRMCRRVRGIFDAAVERGWMKHNPLSEERGWIDTNPERDAYVDAVQFERVMR